MGEGSQAPEQITMKKPEIKGWEGSEATKETKKYFHEGLIKKGDNFLDIGCGFGRNANYLAENGVNVTAINIDDKELKIAQERARNLSVKVNYLQANAVELPFPDQSFDVAMDFGCTHLLENKEDQIKAEKETARVIKPGGVLLYFGFSKDHPSAVSNPDSPQYRSLEDIRAMYANDFEIVSSEETRWRPKPEEGTNVSEHVGLNIVFKRKRFSQTSLS